MREKNREAALAYIPQILSAGGLLRARRHESIRFIEDGGPSYDEAVDWSRNGPGEPINGWHVVGPFGDIPGADNDPGPVLDEEVPTGARGLQPRGSRGSLIVPFAGEPYMLAGAAASPELLRAGAPGEISAHVSLARYASEARWVHLNEQGELLVETADRTFRNSLAAIDDHIRQLT